MTTTTPVVPVILSGGSGTRLWPLSRSMRPKQFINLVGSDSLFQKTLTRLSAVPGIQDPLVVCNEEHRFMVAEQMLELGINHDAIILEPVARNTAPAIATAAARLVASGRGDALMLVLPADHLIYDSAAFAKCIERGVNTASEGGIVIFGITPDRPATGFGYIKVKDNPASEAVSHVDAFIEKPDLATAQTYLADGHYYWNSGMFLLTADVCLAEMDRYTPGISEPVAEALKQAKDDLDFLRLEHEHYAKCPNISIDYAVIEHSEKVSMVSLEAGWTDIGSWTSLWESGDKDDSGNVTKGDVLLESVRDSYIHSEHKLVAALGVENLIVVETHDGLMVTTKEHDQDIKKIVEQLKTADRPEVDLHRKAFRPWGNYDCLDDGDRFQVKRIMVKPGEQTSAQRHYHRAEHWIVVKGTAEVTIGETTRMLSENEAAYIPLGEKHRLCNPGKVPLELIEVQSGAYLGEDDIERFDDEYGRS